MGWACTKVGGGKEYIQNFNGETSLKTSTSKNEKEINWWHKMGVKEIAYGIVRIELAQVLVQWWALVLAVLNLDVLLPQC
jgi:hypothetical protein